MLASTFAAVLASISLVTAAPPSTDSNPSDASPAMLEAEALYEAGVRRFDAGEYEEALGPLQASLEVRDDPNTRFAIGQTLKKLGRCPEAIEQFEKGLDSLPDDAEAAGILNRAIRSCADDMAEALTAQSTTEEAPRPMILRLPEPRPVALGKDPGKSWRVGGIATMGVGAFSFVAGIAKGAWFVVRGRGFSEDLRGALNEQDALGCDGSDGSGQCAQVQSEVDSFRSNGETANRFAVVSFAVGGGLGVALLVTGGLVFREGNIRTRQWKSGRVSDVRVLPSLGGISVSGRF